MDWIDGVIESGKKGEGGTVVNIDAHSENANSVDASANASASAMATATFLEACEAVEALDLGENEKIELHDLLAEVRKSKGDETLARHAVKALLDKAIELGFDALKSVLPYVWGFLLALAT